MLTGLRGWLEVADRRNLIRVMPAKGADMYTPARADVLVVGGGVIGLSIAWRAAQRGLRVIVADPDPGSGASRAAAGMITPVSEAAYAERELFRLGRESQRRYPAFAAEVTELTGEPTGYRQAGTLQVAYDADDLALLGEYQALQESFGVQVRRLTARECRQAEPLLDPAIRGGLLADDDASVDPRLLTRALLIAAGLAGADIIRQPVTEILTAGSGPGGGRQADGRLGNGGPGDGGPGNGGLAGGGPGDGGRVAGARLADGTQILAPWVVLAAGWSSASIAGLPAGAVPPVRPVKGQILRLRGPSACAPAPWAGNPAAPSPGSGGSGPPAAVPDLRGGSAPPVAGRHAAAGGQAALLARSVRGIVHGSAVYLVPRDSGELVIGATQEEQGADTRVTAGGVWELLRDARTIVPGITELELAEAVAGLRPGTPDNAPILGPSALPGLVLATGHFRAGVLLAPVTADVITDYLITGRLPDLAAAFTPQRFARPARPAGAGRGRTGVLPRAAGLSTSGESARP